MTAQCSNEVRAALALLPDPVIGPCFAHWITPTTGVLEPVVLRKCPQAGGGPGMFVLAGNPGTSPTVMGNVFFGLN